jgi:phosphatidylserine/phosphatidylglycerophosphate/cardiolipin synthase-like enzyme
LEGEIGRGMKKVVFIVLFSLWIFRESPAVAEIEAIFSPEGSIKESLLKEVESTTSTFELAIHEITSLDLARALLKAKQRGVKVRIIADSKQAKMKSSQVIYLIHQGIPVKVLGGKGKGVMNHRFAIFDGKKVMTGSYDWLGTSEKWNYENILILSDSEAVAFYQKEFDRLWREKRVIK